MREKRTRRFYKAIALFLTASLVVGCSAGPGNLTTGGEANDMKKGYSLEKVEDPIFLEEEKASFDLLWLCTNKDENSPGYGLVRDRYTNEHMASVASVGYALAGYGIGVENGWISREEGAKRALKTLDTLLKRTEQIEGFFYHFVDMETGERYQNTEVSIIDTAIAVNGALFAGEYFGGEVKAKAEAIYRRINWNWYRNEKTNQFYMSYLPEDGRHTGKWSIFAEQLMTYFLSAASPTYPAPVDMIYKLDRTETTWEGMYPYIDSPANSIFTYQFSHAWFDLRNMVDNKGWDWYQNSVVATLSARQFCLDNREIFQTFHKDSWGLTACDGPFGYSGRYGANPYAPNDGTVPPAGSAGSAPFAPGFVAEALNYMRGIEGLWTEYGFMDAYNAEGKQPMIMEDYVTIDKGISLVMLENQRTGLVWDYMNRNEYVQKGLKLTGFMSADTRLIEDGDSVHNHKGMTGAGLKVLPAKEPGTVENCLELLFDSGDGPKDLSLQLDNLKPEPETSDVIRLSVRGKAAVAVTLEGKDGEIGTTAAATADGSEWTTLELDISQWKEEARKIRGLTFHFSENDPSVLVDEIMFAATESQVRNVTITERPYVGNPSKVSFDYMDTGKTGEVRYAYQWSISDHLSKGYTPIEGANEPEYTPQKADAGRYLRVTVTPVDQKGQAVGRPAESLCVSRISEDMPLVKESIGRIVQRSKGRLPDDISGDTMSILSYWNDGGDGAYQLSQAENGPLTVNFKKNDREWAYMIRNITAQDISKYKRLAIDIKGDMKILIKLEQRDATPIGEVELQLTPEGHYYEWDLEQHGEQLKNVGNILIFGYPGELNGEGSMEIGQLEFSVEKAEKNRIVSKGISVNPSSHYDGTSETFDFNRYWMDGGDGVYRLDNEADGTVTVTASKKGAPEWALLRTGIEGKLEGFQKIVVEVSGDKGLPILWKAEGSECSAESGILNLTGADDTIEIDLEGLTAEQRNSLHSIMLFVHPGDTYGGGQLKIKKAYFSKEPYSGQNLVEYIHRYKGDGEDFLINDNWYDGGEGVYLIGYPDMEQGVCVVNYDKKRGSEYSQMRSNVRGALGDFDYLNLELEGTPWDNLLIKIEGDEYVQEYLWLMGEEREQITIPLDKAQNCDGIKQVMIFALPGMTEGSGQFRLSQVYFSKEPLTVAGEPVVHQYDGEDDKFHIYSGYYNPENTVYKIKEDGKKSQVICRKAQGQEWSYFQVDVDGTFHDFDYLNLDIEGQEGSTLLVKLETERDSIEERFKMTGRRQKVGMELEKTDDNGMNYDELKKVMFFLLPGTVGKSQVTFYDTCFSNDPPRNLIGNEYKGGGGTFDINRKWQVGDKDCYDVTTKDGQTTVKVTKHPEDEWENIYSPVSGNFSDFKFLNFSVRGNGTILLKLEDPADSSNFFEQSIELLGEQQTFQYDIRDLDFLDQLDKVMIFAAPGKIQNIDFKISRLEFTNHLDQSRLKINQYKGDQKDFSVNRNWQAASEEIYEVVEKDGLVHVSARKKAGQEWESLSSPVDGRISDFGFLNLTVQGPAVRTRSAATLPQLLVKLEDPKDPSRFVEHMIALDGTKQRFQFDIRDVEFRDDIRRVLLFPLPGQTGNLDFTIHELKFTNEKDSTLLKINEYEGGGADFDINRYWTSNMAGVYTIQEGSQGTAVNVNKQSGQEWEYMSSPVRGTFSDFDYLNLKVKGQAGQQLLIKMENASNPAESLERYVTLSGAEEELQVRIKGETFLNKVNKVMVFALPGATGTTDFTLKQVFFTKTELKAPANQYTGGGADFDFNHYWTSNVAGIYTTSENNGVFNVNAAKAPGQEWEYIYSPVEGNFADFQYLNLELKGAVGEQLLIKLENPEDSDDKQETYVTLNGDEQKVQIDIGGVGFRNKLNRIMIFALPGTTGTAAFTIQKAYFTNTRLVYANKYTGQEGDFSINQYWTANIPGVYTFQENGGVVTATAVKGTDQEWEYMYSPLEGDFSSFQYLNLEVMGKSGEQLLVKLENPDNAGEKLEQRIDLDGGSQKIQIAIGGQSYLSKLNKVMLFAIPGHLGTTEVSVEALYFTNTKAIQVNEYTGGGADFSINQNWISNNQDIYTIQESDQGAEVTANKPNAGQEYEFMYSPVKGSFTDFKYLNLEVEGSWGEELLVKLENSGNPSVESMESRFTMDGMRQTVQIDISGASFRDRVDRVLLFALPGSLGTTEYTLHKVYFTNTEKQRVNVYDGSGDDFNVNRYWTSNNHGIYTVEESGSEMVVNVTKGVGQEWEFMYSPIQGDLSGFSYLHMKVKGRSGEELIVKLENSANPGDNEEQKIILDGTEQTITMDISGLGFLANVNKVMVFGLAGAAGSTSFTISKMYFSDTALISPMSLMLEATPSDAIPEATPSDAIMEATPSDAIIEEASPSDAVRDEEEDETASPSDAKPNGPGRNDTAGKPDDEKTVTGDDLEEDGMLIDDVNGDGKEEDDDVEAEESQNPTGDNQNPPGSGSQDGDEPGGSGGQGGAGTGENEGQSGTGTDGSGGQSGSGTGGSGGQSGTGAGGSGSQSGAGTGGSGDQSGTGTGERGSQSGTGAVGSGAQSGTGTGGSESQSSPGSSTNESQESTEKEDRSSSKSDRTQNPSEPAGLSTQQLLGANKKGKADEPSSPEESSEN